MRVLIELAAVSLAVGALVAAVALVLARPSAALTVGALWAAGCLLACLLVRGGAR